MTGLPIDAAACNALLRAVLNKPWAPRAPGPAAFDCYTLLQHADRVLFGRTLPDYPAGITASSPKAVRRHLLASPFYRALKRVSEPAHGDYVALCIGPRRLPAHVGIWLAVNRMGGVLHCEHGRGVTFDEPAILKATSYDIDCYRPA